LDQEHTFGHNTRILTYSFLTMAISRCLGSLGLIVAGAEGARIARKKKNIDGSDAPQDCYSPYDGMSLLRLTQCTPAQKEGIQLQLEEAGCTFLEDYLPEDCSDTEVVCSAEQSAELEERGMAKVVSSDAGSFWRDSSGVTQSFAEGIDRSSNFYTTWRDLDAQMAHLESVVQASGGVARLETAGQSLEGRDMKIVRFRGAGYVAGGKRVFATFNLHAREWLTGMSGLYSVEQLVAKIQQDPSYLDGTEVVFMPMANPDGFVYSTTTSRMHRKNMAVNSGSSCRGVDLNRNYDAHWNQGGSSGSACSDVFHGPSPMSEPETVVVAEVLNEAETTVYIDVHSYSELIISSYGWTRANHPRAAEYRDVGGKIQAAIRTSGGKTWVEGPTAQTLYAASGITIDYADDRGALGICFELRPGRSGGGGFAPPASDIIPGTAECWAGLLAAIDYAKSYVPPVPTPAPPPGTWQLTGTGCEMTGNCIQSKNHPSNYGNSESCNVELYGDVPLRMEAFNTESRYDILTVGGTGYSGSSGPSNGAYSGSIAWNTDSSVTASGWKLCLG